MSLTSSALVAVLTTIAVAAIAVMIVLWPRLARTAVLTVLGRLGLIALVNSLVMLLALAVLNDQFQFFSDWSDIAGSLTSQSVVVAATEAGGSAHAALAIPVPQIQAPPTPSRATVIAQDSNSTTYLLAGGQSKVTSQVQVFLPAGYTDKTNAAHRYPVLEGFGGYPAAVTSLAKSYELPSALATLTAQQAIAPTIAVVAQPWTPAGRDTECVNGPGGVTAGDQVETWLSVDLPTWVRSTFRARSDRDSWATWGPSAGGWCAAVIAMLHPETFGAFIAFGPYFRVEWGNWVPYAPDNPAAARFDLVARASTDPPPVAAWIYVSKQDSQSWPSTSKFLAAARAPLAVSAHVVAVGGHRTTLWRPWLPTALTWLGQVAPGFAPGVRS